jgi:hypothetical protein
MRWVGVSVLGGISVVGLALLVASPCEAKDTISQDEMVRHAQELADEYGSGNRAPFIKYFADDCLFFNEKGQKHGQKGAGCRSDAFTLRLYRQHQDFQS